MALVPALRAAIACPSGTPRRRSCDPRDAARSAPPRGRRPALRTAATGLLAAALVLAVPAAAGAAGTPAPTPTTPAAPSSPPTPSTPSTPASSPTPPTPPTPTPTPPPLPPAPAPVTPATLPAAYDVAPQYEGQNSCDPTIKPGAQKLADLIRATYGATQSIWIPRSCGAGGQSEHKEGRALDWMSKVSVPQEHANVQAFLDWLLAPGPDGTPAAMARRLGVMYLGWNNEIWRGYGDTGWSELKGCYSKPGAGNDTYCHRDHLHISLTWDGASGRTSYWTGTPLTSPFCDRTSTSAKAPKAEQGLDLVAVTPVRVLDTRTGLGLASGPCRLQQDRWSGDRHRLFVRVTGRGEVPTAGVAAVAVRITALGSNAPGYLRAWAAGATPADVPVLSVPMNANATAAAVIPVGSDGTFGIATATGATDLVVDVVGYFVAPLPTALATGGTLRVPRPLKVFDTVTTGGPLQPGETRTLTLAGPGGIPATGASAVLLSVTPYGAGRSGSVRVSRPGAATSSATPSVYYPVSRPRTGRVLAPLGDGATVTLTNTGTTPVSVKVDLLAWSSAQRDASAGEVVPVKPARIVATRSGVGATGPLGPGRVVSVVVAGKAGVPATGARAVLLQVSTSEGTADGALSVWPSGLPGTGPRSAGIVRGVTTTDLVVVPLGAGGAVSWQSAMVSAQVTAYVVGYVR